MTTRNIIGLLLPTLLPVLAIFGAGIAAQAPASNADVLIDGHLWTLFGVKQSEVEPILRSGKWSVGNAPYQVLAVKDPVSDLTILPFSDPVPNTAGDNSLRVRAWRGEYEPASFVLRSGEHDLSQVKIEIDDLSNLERKGFLSHTHVDARVVRCWYQAGLNLRRQRADRKRLTPELLLHDPDLVRVDYEKHVNLVRDIRKLEDSDVLRPFDVPARANQQVWITVHVPVDCMPGTYGGNIRLSFSVNGKEMAAIVPIRLEVDPRVLPESPIEYALFYLGRFDPIRRGLGARVKSEYQLEAEFRDMRQHGLTNVTVDYEYRKKITGEPDFSRLVPVLKAMRRGGFVTKRLLFVDWRLGGAENAEEYSRKLTELKKLAAEHGFGEVYVYNNDERDHSVLLENRKTFEIAHQSGHRNFVACTLRTASRMDGLLDVAIVPRSSGINSMFCNGEDGGSCVRIAPWAYSDPQAGMELPETYRRVYGLSLAQDGFCGVCNYAYQSGDCWDDWGDKEEKWRPHVMAYPTFGAPIPTLQWEGFREAIDDVRKASVNQLISKKPRS